MIIYRMTNIKTGEIIEGTETELLEKEQVSNTVFRNNSIKNRVYAKTWVISRVEEENRLHEHYVRLGLYKTCAICGKEFLAQRITKICCSTDCSKKRNNEMVKSIQKKARSQKSKKPKKKETLSEIAVKARKAGMTYGQYVAMMGL